MKFYFQLCVLYLQSENAVDCTRCGYDRIVQDGGYLFV